LLGVLAVTAIARFQPQYPIALSWSAFAIGAAVSIVLGLLAGSLPGRAAVRIQPVAALR
jgi:ABC-type antimicrobial peptide transport system permease subunit